MGELKESRVNAYQKRPYFEFPHEGLHALVSVGLVPAAEKGFVWLATGTQLPYGNAYMSQTKALFEVFGKPVDLDHLEIYHNQGRRKTPAWVQEKEREAIMKFLSSAQFKKKKGRFTRASRRR